MEFLGKQREVKVVQKLICEAEGCYKESRYTVQFKDGLWTFMCADHASEAGRNIYSTTHTLCRIKGCYWWKEELHGCFRETSENRLVNENAVCVDYTTWGKRSEVDG